MIFLVFLIKKQYFNLLRKNKKIDLLLTSSNIIRKLFKWLNKIIVHPTLYMTVFVGAGFKPAPTTITTKKLV